ncbi:MAG: helix-turn-helix domain-containing protein [Alphaproteobacteria bacterium]|nr:helix-turn-helix domain-containing protein [Alphaproteobacteria bacterium]MDA7983850.1 helix-turn-helix domain-containing protein [Alphaproteobacteria bacterium]MDA8002115.1 helix-turn-helix domain-containing protein [Alphaproteobacteria bacterium]MDA8003647.1 helix-turn-helix domain-containing protein [Alphaproteobacteria bacterium]MDA8005851.1 helix-turn-helix domain-containing protein [Alphaproteobacteria bacterium]
MSEIPENRALPVSEMGAMTPAERRRYMVDSVRARIRALMENNGLNRSTLARRAGLERSTVSQLLSERSARLPSVETLGQISESFHVSMDWLLGRRALPDDGISVMDTQTTITSGEGPSYSPISQWYLDARGYKIRYVPSNLPDLLKNRRVTRHEYSRLEDMTTPEAQDYQEVRLNYQRQPDTDMECCLSMQTMRLFAAGSGLWEGLSVSDRAEQLRDMARLTRDLYPSFRWFLFEGRRQFVPPMTIFGIQRVAFYIGRSFLVLNNPEQVRHFIRQFDGLIRDATHSPTEVPDYLLRLADSLDSDSH